MEENLLRLKKKIVIYTAVTKGYDVLLDTEQRHPDCDYVAFCDYIPDTQVWELRPFIYDHPNSAKKI